MFVECRSFGDLSNRSAIVEQTPVNSTVVVESETKNEELPEVANGTFNADNLNLNETEILPTDNNITFECNKISTKPEENETFSVELEKDQQDDFDKTPTNIEVQETVEGSSPQEAVKLSVEATKHEETSSEPEVVSEIPEEKCVDTKVDVTPQILEPSTQDETTPTKDSNRIFIRIKRNLKFKNRKSPTETSTNQWIMRLLLIIAAKIKSHSILLINLLSHHQLRTTFLLIRLKTLSMLSLRCRPRQYLNNHTTTTAMKSSKHVPAHVRYPNQEKFV